VSSLEWLRVGIGTTYVALEILLKRATIDIISGGRTSGVYHVGVEVEVEVEHMNIRMSLTRHTPSLSSDDTQS
jgi:hypothetical protein